MIIVAHHFLFKRSMKTHKCGVLHIDKIALQRIFSKHVSTGTFKHYNLKSTHSKTEDWNWWFRILHICLHKIRISHWFLGGHITSLLPLLSHRPDDLASFLPPILSSFLIWMLTWFLSSLLPSIFFFSFLSPIFATISDHQDRKSVV